MGRNIQMPKVKLKYVHIFRDRHGRRHVYLRIPGQKAVPLSGAVGSPEFMLAYQAGIAQQPQPAELGASRTVPGTINAAIVASISPQRRLRRSLPRPAESADTPLSSSVTHMAASGWHSCIDRTSTRWLPPKPARQRRPAVFSSPCER